MIKVLFVCHGNICRSPMAEFLLKDMVNKAGLKKSVIPFTTEPETSWNLSAYLPRARLQCR